MRFDLCILVLLNPKACTESSGIDVLLRSVVDCPQVQMMEAVLGVVFFIINHPSTRCLLKENFGLEVKYIILFHYLIFFIHEELYI